MFNVEEWNAKQERDALVAAVHTVLSKHDCSDLLDQIAATAIKTVDRAALKQLLGLDKYNPASDIVLDCVQARFAPASTLKV